MKGPESSINLAPVKSHCDQVRRARRFDGLNLLKSPFSGSKESTVQIRKARIADDTATLPFHRPNASDDQP